MTINVARSQEQAERQAKGEDLSVREETSMDDLGLEVGQALAEAGPGASGVDRLASGAPIGQAAPSTAAPAVGVRRSGKAKLAEVPIFLVRPQHASRRNGGGWANPGKPAARGTSPACAP